MLIFDIETGPVSTSRLRELLPAFDPSSIDEPGEFDPASVKLGQLKDQTKIDAKIEAARSKHAAEVAGWSQKLIDSESAYWKNAVDKAALSAHTCEVVAIGYRNTEGATVIDHIIDHPEPNILQRFWTQFMRMRNAHRKLIGFNSNRFDVPILARRSWICGIEVPTDVFTPTGYLSPVFVDLMKMWACGVYGESISLDMVCRAAGIGGKPDDCTGAMFHEMLRNPETFDAAINYLRNDLMMTANLAAKLGVI